MDIAFTSDWVVTARCFGNGSLLLLFALRVSVFGLGFSLHQSGYGQLYAEGMGNGVLNLA